MVCLNCNNTFESDYCPHCGQKAKTKRLRLTEIVNNFIGSFIGGDNKFLRTCLDLICRPGYMVRNYLNGKRVRYYNPLQLYVFMLTLYAVVSYVLGVSDSIIDDMTNLDLDTDVEASKYASVDFIIKCIAEVGSNKLYGTLVIAFFSSFPYLWFFRKCKVTRPDGQQLPLNLTEQFYTQMYHSCISLFFSVAMLPLCLVKSLDTIVIAIYQIVTIAYIVILYRQLMAISWWKSIVLNAISLLLTIILFIVSLMLIAVIAGVIETLTK